MMKYLLAILFSMGAWVISASPAIAQSNCEGETVDGQKTGHWKCFYDDGTVAQEGDYEADKKVGEWVFYHSNGNMALKGNYTEDKETGKWVVYDETGAQIDEIDYGD
ncbi:MAG: hypothetical protein AAFQ98_02680 [Bacteroidota bacterium]